MDPQKLSQLDPKLREAYQRVMGTPIPQPQVAPIQAQTPPPPTPPMPDPNPAPPPQPEPVPTPPPAGGPTPIIEDPSIPQQPMQPPPAPASEPAIPEPQPAIQPEPPVQTTNFDQMNSEVAAAPSTPNFSVPQPALQAQTMAIKKKNGMMPILIGIGGVFFLAVYTLFWTKVFNFKLPFLP